MPRPATTATSLSAVRALRRAASLASLLAGSLWAFGATAQPSVPPTSRPAAARDESPAAEHAPSPDTLAPIKPQAEPIGQAAGGGGQAAAAASDADRQSGAGELAPPATRLEAEIEFRQFLAAKKYAEAAKVGTAMLAMTQKQYGKQSVQAAAAQASLAGAQSLAGDYGAAEQSYLAAVAAYRGVDGLYNTEVIKPLVGLGDNYRRNKQYTDAIAAYQQARSVSRHEYGLLNAGQIEILDRITEIFATLNDYKNADKQQAAELEIVERTHKDYDPATLQAIYKYALWLRRTQRFDDERKQYARAERIIRAHYGKDSLKLVEPLQRTGNSYRIQLDPENAGLNALQNALEILQKNPDAPQLTKAEVLRDIGDWQTAFDRGELDNSDYRRAWSLLGSVKSGEALRRQWFTGAIYVLRAPIDRRGLSSDPDSLSGHVIVKFDLDRNGRPQNVSVFKSEPPGMEDSVFLRHVRESRFRPQMQNGQVVAGKRLGLRFTFWYKPDEGKQKRKKRKKRK